MGIFRKGRDKRAPRVVQVQDEEPNPELAAAEALVNQLPGPPPSANPFFDIVLGARPRMVSFPDDESDADAHLDPDR